MVPTPNYWPLRVPVGAGADGLAAAGDAAVSRLAAAAGLTLAPVPTSKGGPDRASSADLLPIVGAGLGVLAALAALAIVLPRARWRLAASRERRRMAGRAGFPGRLRWALPGSAVCALAVATPLVVLHRGSSQVSESAAVKAPLLSWPAGRRAAPGFVLRDQNGKKVSLAAYRTRTVIVTFIDPLCRNLCPLEAQVLNQAVREMPPSQRPVILAVSVDVYGDARSHLLQDEQEWHLVPQWRWAVGGSAQLANVWNHYGIAVKVTNQTVAGVPTINVAHTEAAYLVDATGHERAVFAWPFYPQDVERVLQQLV